MKRFLILLVLIISTAVVFTSCDSEDSVVNPPAYGTLTVNSVPNGATIFIDGEDSGFLTDYTFTQMDPGSHEVMLTLQGYVDTTMTVTVNEDQTTTIIVQLVQILNTTNYGPIRVYETEGTTVNQPSGIDLSNGNAYGVSGTDRDSVDLYYFTGPNNSYLVNSAHLHPELTRRTFFYESSSQNLNDGEDSPVVNTPENWGNSMPDDAAVYYFLFDQDGHYSKIKIVGSGGGQGPGDPAWLDVEWIYNESEGDQRF